MKKIILLLTICLSLSALDFRFNAGATLSNNEYTNNSNVFGLELGTISTYKDNGFNYGFKLGFLAKDAKFDSGSNANVNIELIYRTKRTFEPYVTLGATYKKLEDKDYGFGYNYGLGARYAWCNGFVIGGELNMQDLSYKSGDSSTADLDEKTFSSHNILLLIGYRIK